MDVLAYFSLMQSRYFLYQVTCGHVCGVCLDYIIDVRRQSNMGDTMPLVWGPRLWKREGELSSKYICNYFLCVLD